MVTHAHYQKIYQTKDFSNIHFFEANRPINTYHVQQLVESIERDNRLHLHPIIVYERDKKLYILDGQHRFEACKQLNQPVHYVISDDMSIQTVVDDQISKAWQLKDYLHYYKTKNCSEYVKINNLCTKYNVPFKIIYYLLGKQKFNIAKTFKLGEIKLDSKIEKFINRFHSTREYILDFWVKIQPVHVLDRRDFITALYDFYLTKESKFEDLLDSLKNNFNELPKKATTECYFEHFCRIYNKSQAPCHKIKKKHGKKSRDMLN